MDISYMCFEAKKQMSGVEWMDTPYTDAMTIDPAKNGVISIYKK